MQPGTRELTRSAATYAACLVFALTFLVSTATGATGLTAAWRGTIGAVLALFIGRWLALPAVAAVLEAMARDRARQAEEEAAAAAAQERAIAAAKSRGNAE